MGVRLASYAAHWIKSEMHEFVIKNWRIVKIATTKAQRKLFFNLRKQKKRLGWHTEAEIQAVAQDLNVSPKDVRTMEMRMMQYDEAFDAPTNIDDEKAYSPSHYLEHKDQNPELKVLQNDQQFTKTHQLRAAMAQLDQRSQDIVASRWLVEKKATLDFLAKIQYFIRARSSN